jgi:hypothetical protein
MRVFLIALAASIVGCATIEVPEVSRTLRDYNPEPFEPAQGAIPLPEFQFSGTTTVDSREVVYLTEDQFILAEKFIEAAKGNTEALKHRNRAWNAVLRERNHVLVAGQAAESQAALWQEMYRSEVQYCNMIQFVSIGGVGLIALAAIL